MAVQARDREVIAGLRLAEAEGALGRWAEARQAYTQVRVRALEIEDPRPHDASAGLARVALAEGDAAAALAALQPVLDLLAASGTLDIADDPDIGFVCYQVLARAGDPRADKWLARAHAALMAQADAITDAALRQGFLQNIPHHREIAAAWAMRGPSGEPGAEAVR